VSKEIKLDVIILSGGEGTRLRSILPNIPKPLAPINGKPFLDLLLAYFSKWTFIKNVILAVGYKSEKIINRYKNYHEYDFDILFSQEQQLLGTGGAIKKAFSLSDTECVLVINGDTFVEIDVDDLLEFHKKNSAIITIVLKETHNTARYGTARIDYKNRIIFFGEKEADNFHGLINAGVYVINKNIFDNIEADRVLSFEKEILPGFIGKNVFGYITYGRFIDIGLPETYEMAQEYLKDFLDWRPL
jgi:D-glycero-alpha-D-manno-heptose 1-phosphate guanylyltransferase